MRKSQLFIGGAVGQSGKKSRKALVRQLDMVFAEYIQKRDGHCVICGSKDNLQCGHLFSRVAYSTRWDERNAYCQCGGCNLRHEHDFEPLRRVAVRRLGEDGYNELYALHKQYVKVTNEDLHNKIIYFTGKLKEVNNAM